MKYYSVSLILRQAGHKVKQRYDWSVVTGYLRKDLPCWVRQRLNASGNRDPAVS